MFAMMRCTNPPLLDVYFIVLSDVIWGCPGSLFWPSRGSTNRIFLASIIRAQLPSEEETPDPYLSALSWGTTIKALYKSTSFTFYFFACTGWLRWEVTDWFSVELQNWKQPGTTWYRAVSTGTIDRGCLFSVHPVCHPRFIRYLIDHHLS